MSPMRILIVDDEAQVRDVLKRHLRRDGHYVESASDGIEAVAASEKAPFDAVITDLNMPRMGGVELVRRLKAAAPQTIVIVLTGHGTLDAAVEVLREGCDDFLLKPVPDLGLVSHTIERCAARRNALVLAVSSRRIGQAKDNILTLVLEEAFGQLAELRGYLDTMEDFCAASDHDGLTKTTKAMRTQMTYFDAILQDVKVVNHTLRERDELRIAAPELEKKEAV